MVLSSKAILMVYFLGYNPDILGQSRVTGVQINIKKQAEREDVFTEGKSHRRKGNKKELYGVENKPNDETIIKMQHEILYLRQEEEDRADFGIILIAYNHRGYSKGARGIYMCMLHMDPPVIMNLKKIKRLMKKYRLECPVRYANPYLQMQKAIKTSNYADNLLLREFERYGP